MPAVDLRKVNVSTVRGKGNQGLAPMLGDMPGIEAPHPSPVSASRGFFGQRPFSGANALLEQQGATVITWARA